LFLKNITLRGFKSFAKKSQLEFGLGVNVIVGPNGSGKSNITDAISWVLGEQSAKSLRGTSMEDVIFKSRNEELAIADVSLIFDNKDKFLPLEFDEVKITRRVYQKGGSEYFINSTPSRLTDILDLTSERGIGKGLYTIINQGQIDEVALLKPLDRKMVVDEILGIARHKHRRNFSKNKLLKITSDMERINDLILEVKRTMDPLEIDSRKAQKYFEISNTLKEEELSLFVSEMENLNSNWELENEKISDLEKNFSRTEFEITDIENERNLYESDFAVKKQVFESLKKKIENFNNFKNKFESNELLIESKKNTFSTLNNILNTQFSTIKSSVSQLSNIAINEKDTSYSREIRKKINILSDKINKIFQRILPIMEDKQIFDDFKTEYESIVEDIRSLDDYISSNYPDSGKGIVISNGKNSKDANSNLASFEKKINERLENIQKIQNYCSSKIIQSENFLKIMLNLNATIDEISERVYSGFDEIITEINDYNSKTNDFIKNINESRLRKQSIENELYKINFRKDQIREKVKNLTTEIIETYNLPMEFITKNYKPSENIEKSRRNVRSLKNELKEYGSVNPNATSEFQILKERFNFLQSQKDDLSESKKKLEILIKEINKKIEEMFESKFDEINTFFKMYFKLLFPLGKGELILQDIEVNEEKDYGIELKTDIGNSKIVPITLLSGGEKALVSVAFLFAVFSANYSPFYVFDEIDASLDDMNLNRFVSLVKKFSASRQTIIITHQKKTMEIADVIYGVTMQSSGMSKIISEKVDRTNAEIN
jgi:chromosome segregation protein